MKRFYFWLTMLWLCVTPAPAQEKTAEAKSPDVIGVIEVKQADVQELATTLSHAVGSLASLTPDPIRRVVIVRGSREAIAFVEQAVKRMDVAPVAQPPKPQLDVELYVHLLYGSMQEGHGELPPTDLVSTVKQLSALFPYKHYTVLESFVLRGRDEQQSETGGSLPNSVSSYRFVCRPSISKGPAPRTIRLDNLRLDIHWEVRATGTYTAQSTIATALDTKEGQKVVVGKSNVAGTGDAIIVVVSPKIIE